ncbi:hypothetical protein BaRGS_00030051, partial [Batillaria attramentaria]
VRDLMNKVEESLNQTAYTTNQNVVYDIVRDLSQVMDADTDVLQKTNVSHRLLEAIGQMSREGALSDGQLTTTSSNLAIRALAVDRQNLSGMTLTAHAGNDGEFQDGEVQVYLNSSVPEISDSVSSLVLPASLLTSLENSSRIALVVHIDGRIFEALSSSETATTEDANYVRAVNSYVMSVSVIGDEEVTNLKDPVIIRFGHLDERVCWGTGNCWTKPLSAAAVFRVRVTVKKSPITHSNVLGSSCEILVDSTENLKDNFRRIKRLNKPSKILVSLCLALALSDLVFVAGMQDYTLRSPVACKVVSMVLHFCLLSSMCWMSVEAFHLYLALVRGSRTRITHFILKASCFGWGVPLVIVAVSAGVNTTDNYTSLNSGICWLTGVAFYVAFVAPVCLILLFNVISFLLVLRVILGLTNNKLNRTQFTQAVQKLRRAVGVIILLGLTWAFGLLAIDGATQIVFHYLFAIFNSLQGLFIFLFYCIFNKSARATCKRCFRCCKIIPCCLHQERPPGETASKVSETETKDRTFSLDLTGESSQSTGNFACASSSGDASTGTCRDFFGEVELRL